MDEVVDKKPYLFLVGSYPEGLCGAFGCPPPVPVLVWNDGQLSHRRALQVANRIAKRMLSADWIKVEGTRYFFTR